MAGARMAALSVLVQLENDALSDLLAHLSELDERRLLAARLPRPDVREAIRRLPTRSEVRAPDGGLCSRRGTIGSAGGPAELPQIAGEVGEASKRWTRGRSN